MTHPIDLRCLARAALAALVTLTFTACGGSDDGPSSAGATMSITAAGGTLDGPGGAQLVVPAGAVTQPTSVTIAQSGGGAPALPAGGADVGSMFALTPHGTAFAVPATIRVPFDSSRLGAGETPTLWKTNATQTGWEQVPGATVSGSVMQAQISSFSWTIIRTPQLPPLIGVQPAPQSVTEPATATFAVGASSLVNSGPLAYQWRRNGVLITGATGPTYTTGPTTVAADNGALYSVDVSNSAGTSPSGTAMLTVSTAPVTTATLTVTVTPAASGIVTSAPAGINCGADCSETYSLDTVVTLTATPAAGFTFSAWSPNCPAGVATMSAGVACTATFVAAPPPAAAGSAAKLSFGGEYALAVDAAGVAYAWGTDGTAQQGNGPAVNTPQLLPTPIPGLTGVRSVSAGPGHGVAVMNDGTARAWGYAGYVDCNFGLTYDPPVALAGLTNIVAASAGEFHTLLLGRDGVVYGIGCNDAGELGRPIGSVPTGSPAGAVPGLPNGIAPNPRIVAVAAGNGFSLALDSDGFVWSWGRAGARGDGFNQFGPPRATPMRVQVVAAAIAIAAGDRHGMALRANGLVATWGHNDQGQLGDGTTTDRFPGTAVPLDIGSGAIGISAARNTSFAVRNDGSVLSWGENVGDLLGTGQGPSVFRAIPGPVLGLTNAVAVSGALALRSDGSVWSWGPNRVGQLGIGSLAPRLAPGPVTGLNLN